MSIFSLPPAVSAAVSAPVPGCEMDWQRTSALVTLTPFEGNTSFACPALESKDIEMQDAPVSVDDPMDVDSLPAPVKIKVDSVPAPVKIDVTPTPMDVDSVPTPVKIDVAPAPVEAKVLPILFQLSTPAPATIKHEQDPDTVIADAPALTPTPTPTPAPTLAPKTTHRAPASTTNHCKRKRAAIEPIVATIPAQKRRKLEELKRCIRPLYKPRDFLPGPSAPAPITPQKRSNPFQEEVFDNNKRAATLKAVNELKMANELQYREQFLWEDQEDCSQAVRAWFEAHPMPPPKPAPMATMEQDLPPASLTCDIDEEMTAPPPVDNDHVAADTNMDLESETAPAPAPAINMELEPAPATSSAGEELATTPADTDPDSFSSSVVSTTTEATSSPWSPATARSSVSSLASSTELGLTSPATPQSAAVAPEGEEEQSTATSSSPTPATPSSSQPLAPAVTPGSFSLPCRPATAGRGKAKTDRVGKKFKASKPSGISKPKSTVASKFVPRVGADATQVVVKDGLTIPVPVVASVRGSCVVRRRKTVGKSLLPTHSLQDKLLGQVQEEKALNSMSGMSVNEKEEEEKEDEAKDAFADGDGFISFC